MPKKGGTPTVIEVFADVCCPFTHVGLRRFVALRHEERRDDIRLWVRSWPLEIVNGHPLEAALIAEEVDELRAQVAPELFAHFDEHAFPHSSLPALALAAEAYRIDLDVGERVSLELRDHLFEKGADIAAPEILAPLAARFEVPFATGDVDTAAILADHDEGRRRGVVGSPHFFTPDGGFFCPALDVSRDENDRLRVRADPDAFDLFIASSFATGDHPTVA